jgi:hypothetical protein
LLLFLPEVRLYAGKDTGGVAKVLYQARKLKGLLASSITSGKLPTTSEALDALHVGVEDVNKVVHLCRSLIANGKQFAMLIPVSIAGEITRLENEDKQRRYDQDLLKRVERLSRIILAQDAEMWLFCAPVGHIVQNMPRGGQAKQAGLALTAPVAVKAAVSKLCGVRRRNPGALTVLKGKSTGE